MPEPPLPDDSREASDPRTKEVRAYLAKLIVLIFIAILLMASVGAWAWFRFAGDLEETTRRVPPAGQEPVAPR
jgi:hypothetical protein